MGVDAGRVEDAETLVFINYRSSDGASAAALLHTELSDRFGAEAVFLDYESIPLGKVYSSVLLDRVRGCAVLLVVVGDRWLAAGDDGQRPIDREGDWVRREILEALAHGVPVVPVLFGIETLEPKFLPQELKILSNLQSFRINRLQRADIKALGDFLVRHIPRLDVSRRRHSPAVLDRYHDVLDRLDDIQLTRRPWLVSRIEAFLAEEPRGYFFIEGKTGVGKTTFVAQLAAEHDYPHHFVSNTGQRRTIAGALRSLGNQLVARYRLDHDPASTGDPVVFHDVLHASAAAAAERGHKLMLVVDGLDQAVEHRDLPLALPATLPDNAYVIATAREGVALYARERPYDHVRIEPRATDNAADIRRHIEETLHADATLRTLVAAKLPVEEFRDTLAQRCAGVWIYLRHALADVRAGRVAPDDLQSLPPDL
ncbi:AAA family ATPase [Actinophytocola sp.]|uniref:AAA family ATPase n=1 Tax=Actinophytocola sp. TaxID=1872138 RepID=UPI002ED4D566